MVNLNSLIVYTLFLIPNIIYYAVDYNVLPKIFIHFGGIVNLLGIIWLCWVYFVKKTFFIKIYRFLFISGSIVLILYYFNLEYQTNIYFMVSVAILHFIANKKIK